MVDDTVLPELPEGLLEGETTRDNFLQACQPWLLSGTLLEDKEVPNFRAALLFWMANALDPSGETGLHKENDKKKKKKQGQPTLVRAATPPPRPAAPRRAALTRSTGHEHRGWGVDHVGGGRRREKGRGRPS